MEPGGGVDTSWEGSERLELRAERGLRMERLGSFRVSGF